MDQINLMRESYSHRQSITFSMSLEDEWRHDNIYNKHLHKWINNLFNFYFTTANQIKKMQFFPHQS